MTTIADILDEYGQAFRGDWGGVDGRSVQYDIEMFASVVRGHGNAPLTDEQVSTLRAYADLCPDGRGCWTMHCSQYCIED